MKKRIFAVLIAVVLVLTAVTFTGCQKTEQTVPCEITVIIGEKTYEVETECRTLHEVLLEMKEQGKIETYEYTGTEISPFVVSVDTLKDYDATTEYIAIFHNIQESSLQQYSTTTWQPIEIEYNGATFYFSYVGIALMPIVDGAQYLLVVTDEMYF